MTRRTKVVLGCSFAACLFVWALLIQAAVSK